MHLDLLIHLQSNFGGVEVLVGANYSSPLMSEGYDKNVLTRGIDDQHPMKVCVCVYPRILNLHIKYLINKQ